MISVRLPDGSKREFSKPVTVAEVASSIGSGLAKAALAGKVDDKLVDTSYVIDRDADLSIITDRDSDGVDILRHSTAHLLAYAVKQLFPDAQVTIGPVIENGFYYDFSYKRPFTPEDLQAIEKKMTELARKNETVIRKVLPRDEAVAYFKSIGEDYKAEIIESIPQNEEVSLYTSGDFTDLCRGPHVPANGKLKVFKLMRVAGAYWRGDSKNEMPGRRRKIRMLIFTCLKKPKNVIIVVWGELLIYSIFRMKHPDLFSGTPRDGRSGSKSNSICAKSIGIMAIRK